MIEEAEGRAINDFLSIAGAWRAFRERLSVQREEETIWCIMLDEQIVGHVEYVAIGAYVSHECLPHEIGLTLDVQM